MNLPDVLFYILAVLTGISAIGVVLTQNIVRAATWLLFTLAGTAGIFFLLGSDFIGAAQLLIYVGGTLVLVVFGVMLTAQGPFINMKIGAAEWAIALGVGLLFYGVLAVALVGVRGETFTYETVLEQLKQGRKEEELLLEVERTPGIYRLTQEQETQLRDAGASPLLVKAMQDHRRSLPLSVHIGAALLGDVRATADGELTGSKAANHHPRSKMHYLLPFEIVSVHLLVVLIGAAYLARAKRRRGATTK
jgi:NADH-quinone oxidoreductase subunit J